MSRIWAKHPTRLLLALCGALLAAAFASRANAILSTDDAFRQADTNGDGVLSRGEIPQFVRALEGAKPDSATAQPSPAAAPTNSASDGINMMPASEVEESLRKREHKRALNEKEGAVTRTLSTYFTIHESFFTDLEASFIGDEDKREGITNPAKLTWTAIHGKKSTYQFDFAIQPSVALIQRWEPMSLGGYQTPIGNMRAAIYPMFEAHVATEEKDSKNQLLYSIAGQLDFSHPQAKFWKGDHFFALASYETDRHSDIGQKRLDILWSPDWAVPGWGQEVSLSELISGLPPNWKFRFRPFAGIESVWINKGFDKFLVDAELPSAEKNYGFIHAGIAAQVRFEDRFTLTSSYNYRAEIYGKPGTHGFFELTASVLLDPAQHFSTGVTYTRGEDSPLFEDLNKVEAWVGVEF